MCDHTAFMTSQTARWKAACLLFPLLLLLIAGTSCVALALEPSAETLEAPANIQASDGEFDDRIRIEWRAVEGAASYEIARSTRQFSAYAPLAVTTDPWYEDHQLLPSQSYYYRVRAQTGDAMGPWSASDLGYWAFLPPASVVASKAGFADRVRVSWDPVAVTQYYYLYRAANVQGPYIMIGMIRETWYEDTGISPGKTYYYKLRSLTSSTGSSLSSWAAGFADATLSISKRYLCLTK